MSNYTNKNTQSSAGGHPFSHLFPYDTCCLRQRSDDNLTRLFFFVKGFFNFSESGNRSSKKDNLTLGFEIPTSSRIGVTFTLSIIIVSHEFTAERSCLRGVYPVP